LEPEGVKEVGGEEEEEQVEETDEDEDTQTRAAHAGTGQDASGYRSDDANLANLSRLARPERTTQNGGQSGGQNAGQSAVPPALASKESVEETEDEEVREDKKETKRKVAEGQAAVRVKRTCRIVPPATSTGVLLSLAVYC